MERSAYQFTDIARGLTIVVAFILAIFVTFLLFLFAVAPSSTVAPKKPVAASASGGPNVVASGMSNLGAELVYFASSTQYHLSQQLTGMTESVSKERQISLPSLSLGSGLATTSRHVQTGTSNIGLAARNTFLGVFSLPKTAAVAIADTPVVTAWLRPAENVPVAAVHTEEDHAGIPETDLPVVTITAAPKEPVQPSPLQAIWPTPGRITTLFGVPHYPFQKTHSGLDIADGNGPGISPIHPILPGTVTDTIWSSRGLGNHVVVDHGNGLTSTYGHMQIISVKIGQHVDTTSLLGRTGSTGVSTGTHLHLEIRENGNLVDPLKYVHQ